MTQLPPSPPSLEPWLKQVAGFERARVIAITPLDGGASNIACRVSLADGPRDAVVLRVQRDRGIFEPYDVIREGEVLRRLRRSLVPVPALLACEPGTAVLGAPFIVMEWVDAPHMGVAGPAASYPAFTAAVAGIHATPWRSLGLDFLGVPESPAAALGGELDLLEARKQKCVGSSVPLLERAHGLLRRTVPADGALDFCQGDINVFNYLFRDRQVVAVVDWEQARISDRRSDVGQLVALSHLKGAPFGPAGGTPFVQMYEAAAGLSLPRMEWFRARWLWELGVIYHAWRSFNGSDPWYTWDDLERLLTASLAEL